MVYFNTDTILRAKRAQAEYEKGTTVGGRRAALYAPNSAESFLTWHPRREVTSLVGAYRLSNGNLGCPWPVDRSATLQKERSGLHAKLSRYESGVDRLEALLREKRTRGARPATTGGALAPPEDAVDAGAPLTAGKSVRFRYPRRNPPPVRPPRPFDPNSGFGKQPLSVLPSVPGPLFSTADVRNDPFPYWPLTLNSKGRGDHHERVVRLGKDMPMSRWRTAPSPKFSTEPSHNMLRTGNATTGPLW